MNISKLIVTGITFLAVLPLLACSSLQGGAADIVRLLDKAEKDIIKASSIEEINRRDILMNQALQKLREAETIAKTKNLGNPDIHTMYAFYYLFKGEYVQVKNYLAIAKAANSQNGYNKIIEANIVLNEKGGAGSAEAISLLLAAKKITPGLQLADKIMGDAYFSAGNFSEARTWYSRILAEGKDFQVDAAFQMELIYKIQNLKIDPRQIKGILFSKGVKRDDIAYLLAKEYAVARFIRSKGAAPAFKDISGSMYADSITQVCGLGMFSFIKDDRFSPFSTINRGELARIIEDFIVAATGNVGFRSKYSRADKSPIKDVESNMPYYNAARIAVEKEIMDLTLGGSFKPLDAVDGFDAVVTLNRMIKNYNKR